VWLIEDLPKNGRFHEIEGDRNWFQTSWSFGVQNRQYAENPPSTGAGERLSAPLLAAHLTAGRGEG
jgi:hypothetical protein